MHVTPPIAPGPTPAGAVGHGAGPVGAAGDTGDRRDFNTGPARRLANEPDIVLTWLVRLRWLAVAGQLLAITVAGGILKLRIAVLPITCVIAATVVSNLLVARLMRRAAAPPPRGLVPALIVLDVLLLTALLYYTGGAQNPFSILYVIHIVMAVVVLGAAWTWLIAAVACASFALLMFFHRPLGEQPLPPMAAVMGQWIAFALVAVLIGSFVSRVTGALRQREVELSSTRDRVARSEQLASLSTLAAGAAHELGTPLGTIAVIAKELELASARDAFVNEDAKLIRQEVDRCRAILDRMRVDIIESLHHTVTSVPLSELIERLRSDLPPEERARLEVHSIQPLKYVTGPVRAIEQAVHVLLRNAFDATPADRPVRLEIRAADGRTMFTVIDRGTGMPDDVLRRAGRPFFTTKEPGKGMGLGLFLVRLVAERYGGQFELTSSEGVGTRSTLVIPESGPSDDGAA
ncbi:MAG TPA: ATP-binding protein [Tepidisphaeraceae bacterium]|nr:ATP-binding protein [Tepidisphaeraceae bacterium]